MSTEMTNWKTLYKKESWGNHSFGIEIRAAIDRPLNENDEMAMHRIADEIEEAIMRETMRLDPEAQKAKKEENTKLMECFGGENIYALEIPNGYSPSWEYSQTPWYKVTTRKGVVEIGWRKRVIEISWEPSVNSEAYDLFPDEDVTRMGRTIHAWGYDKAKAYISRLLAP
jgi:hypothetical protein